MFGILSGTKCHVCGMALENPLYARSEHGDGLYWANPKLSEFTDERLDFCGAQHSVQWFQEQIEARKNVTQGSPDQSSD